MSGASNRSHLFIRHIIIIIIIVASESTVHASIHETDKCHPYCSTDTSHH
jgi:hypothetical protein